jgi:3-hydroxyacyl-[acyl-carrier-protein] dehydratase
MVFAGSLPGKPVVPGVILCEMLAQIACVLLGDKMQEGSIPMFAGMNNIRLRIRLDPVIPMRLSAG